ncbi:uncharacterized protein BDV17DRAFT_273619 [Aspergillus undulatus]|uniref:uncharacterized protein n=1 Tax=Aspergillus undulatus TaxID=1810928 RepID=UPI003CCC9841
MARTGGSRVDHPPICRVEAFPIPGLISRLAALSCVISRFLLPFSRHLFQHPYPITQAAILDVLAITMPRIVFLLLTILALSPSISGTKYPPCVETCISNNRSNSWCQGDETGRAREECLCRGLEGRPIIECIQSCSPEDQWDFAGDLPETCRERLFPQAREEDSGVDEGVVGSGVEMSFGLAGFAILSVLVVMGP